MQGIRFTPALGSLPCFVTVLLLSSFFVSSVWCANPIAPVPSRSLILDAASGNSNALAPVYSWETQPTPNGAQLLTLFCRSCSPDTVAKVPLISVLRDTLGDTAPENDRVVDVWLLGYAKKTLVQRSLAAVPFFYWRVKPTATLANSKGTKPLMDLTAPMHPMATNLSRQLLQWAAFDPLTTPIRASTRAYRTNEVEDERLHLEETIELLQHAPVGNGASQLTQSERDTVIARLDLRKQLLGGLVGNRQAAKFTERSRMQSDVVRGRNWELLRISAERTGLYFEPLTISGTSNEYAILWFPVGASPRDSGSNLRPIWKLLNLQDPWRDHRLLSWSGPRWTRQVDKNGALLAGGESSETSMTLVPLAVYSLLYPKSPLLLTDFRRAYHVKTHEMLQRSITEVTSGVIGISHFTNWYYYAAAAAYDFVASRHGSAMDEASRLDCYAQFRVRLALDAELDPVLRSALDKGVSGMGVNPLESSPEQELSTAVYRYASMQEQLHDSGQITMLLEKQRRAELAAFGRSKSGQAFEAMQHTASLGLYRAQAHSGPDLLSQLDRNRRIEGDLDLLGSAVSNGTAPEMMADITTVRRAALELKGLLPEIQSQRVKDHARVMLAEVQRLTRDSALQSECAVLLAVLAPAASSEKEDSFRQETPTPVVPQTPSGNDDKAAILEAGQ